MDPKLSNLDPKLQDAYNRVMGASSPGNTIPQPSAPPPPQNPDPAMPNPFAQPQNPVTNPTSNPFNPMPSQPQAAPPPISSFQQPNFNPAPPPMPAPEPPPAPVAESAAPPPMPAMPEPTPAPAPIPSSQTTPANTIPGVNSTVAFNATDSHKNVGTTPVKKGGLHLMPLLIGVGIVFLLLAYTFVWIILFDVQLPFLPAI